jgi:prepilin-type N-terminal cleavage/methylation domain-containing protein
MKWRIQRTGRPGEGRAGFTLIELLVVVAVIGLLVALLLPALSSVVSAARRTRCMANLKQIGLALRAYHTTHGMFPIHMSAGRLESARSNAPCTTAYFSWHARLLPYLEQQAVYDLINFDRSMADTCDRASVAQAYISADHPNATAANARIDTFLCPEDGAENNASMGSALPAPTSYAGNMGWPMFSTGIDGRRSVPAPPNGFFVSATLDAGTTQMFRDNSVTLPGFVREQDCSRGLSHVVAVSERLISPVWDGRAHRAPLRSEDFRTAEVAYSSFSGDFRFRSICSFSWQLPQSQPDYVRNATSSHGHVDPFYVMNQGRAWISGWAYTAPLYMHVFRVNSASGYLADGQWNGENIVTPSSGHAGGVHALMGDGSVHFIDQKMDMAIWWAIGSRNETDAPLPNRLPNG